MACLFFFLINNFIFLFRKERRFSKEVQIPHPSPAEVKWAVWCCAELHGQSRSPAEHDLPPPAISCRAARLLCDDQKADRYGARAKPYGGWPIPGCWSLGGGLCSHVQQCVHVQWAWVSDLSGCSGVAPRAAGDSQAAGGKWGLWALGCGTFGARADQEPVCVRAGPPGWRRPMLQWLTGWDSRRRPD